MRNIKLVIKYDGTKYKGWQRLGNSDMTIQDKIEKVLSRMTEEKIEIIGSGRTDVGVHALGQVANFITNSTMSNKEMKEYLYHYLPDDIVVDKVEETDERFHARYNVKSKTYVYRIWNDKYHDPFLRKYIEHIPQRLDIGAMEKGAAFLIGEHDFTSFRSSKSKKKSNIRTIYSIDIKRERELLEIVIKGNGFLHNMVRIIAGTLVEVGLGKLKPSAVKEILEKQDRIEAGPTLSPRGLHLLEVEY